MSKNEWDAELYDQKHSFVWKRAASVVESLDPKPGERILDLGCGTGQLTSQIAESGATVVGMDLSLTMIDEARRLFPHIDFVEADAHDFVFAEPFDAVFSNAALHWIEDSDLVCRCIAKSLKPSGRMVVEFGGSGNIRHLVAAIETAFESATAEQRPHPWYFPNIPEFTSVLDSHGIETIQAALIDRPTPLEGNDGLRNWVKMFGGHWLNQLDVEYHDQFFEQIEQLALPSLLNDQDWFADYRRIRISAKKDQSANH